MRRSKPATVYCSAGLRTGSRADGRADVRSARSLIWHAPRSASVVRGRPKLFERACGYVKGVKIYPAEDGGVIKVSYEVHPQDTQVGTLWLAYQVLRRWGDRQVHGRMKEATRERIAFDLSRLKETADRSGIFAHVIPAARCP
jgi:hypothetical protein